MFALLIVAFIIWNGKPEHQRKGNVIGDVAVQRRKFIWQTNV